MGTYMHCSILRKDASGDAASNPFHYVERTSEKSHLLKFGHSTLKVVLTKNVFPKFLFFLVGNVVNAKVRMMSENVEFLLVNPEF